MTCVLQGKVVLFKNLLSLAVLFYNIQLAVSEILNFG